MSRRGVAGFIGVAVVLLVVIGIIGSEPDSGAPLDPANPQPAGTKALRVLIEELGAEVSVADREPGSADVVLILRDRLTDASHDRLRGFVAAGGTLVVADPSSPLANGAGRRRAGSGNECTIEGWQDYDIDLVQPAVTSLDPAGGDYCLGTARGAVVTTRAEGDGVVVSVADASLFTNQYIGRADNARMAIAAVAPSATTRLVILDPGFIETPLPGTGDQSLWDLVPTGLKWALLQLAVAFGVVVLALSRRHGRPVPEGPVVELPSSELVAATGTMYERAQQPGFAATILQDDLRRMVAARCGLASSASPADLGAAAQARFGVSSQSVEGALTSSATDEAALLDIAHAISRIRQEVHDG